MPRNPFGACLIAGNEILGRMAFAERRSGGAAPYAISSRRLLSQTGLSTDPTAAVGSHGTVRGPRVADVTIADDTVGLDLRSVTRLSSRLAMHGPDSSLGQLRSFLLMQKRANRSRFDRSSSSDRFRKWCRSIARLHIAPGGTPVFLS